MKSNAKKLAIFLAAMLAMVACGGNSSSSIIDNSSNSQPSQTSNTDTSNDKTSDGGGDQTSQGGQDQSSQGGQDQSSQGGHDQSSQGGHDQSSQGGQDQSSQGSGDQSSQGGQDQSSQGGHDQSSQGSQDQSSQGSGDQSSQGGQDQSSQGSGDQSSQGGQDQSSQGGESTTITSSSDSSSSSSSGGGSETDPKYEQYLLRHTEGQKANYIFEAENTDTRGKSGTGYSGGTSTYRDFAATEDSGRGYITYLYREGISINFFVVSDRNVNDAKFSVMLGAEFMRVYLTPDSYKFRVDPDLEAVAEEYEDPTLLEDVDVNTDGSLGNWDSFFLDWYTVEETGGYYIDEWECGEIDIGEDGCELGDWSLHEITLNLSLKRGINCISLITANNEIEGDSPHGTMGATAPVVDYISIETTAQLGVFNAKDLGQGGVNNAVHFDK